VIRLSSNCCARTKAGNPCKAVAVQNGLCMFHAHPEKAAQLGRIGGSKNRHYSFLAENERIRPPQTGVDVNAFVAAGLTPGSAV
jgi:hypothetical protein